MGSLQQRTQTRVCAASHPRLWQGRLGSRSEATALGSGLSGPRWEMKSRTAGKYTAGSSITVCDIENVHTQPTRAGGSRAS